MNASLAIRKHIVDIVTITVRLLQQQHRSVQVNVSEINIVMM